MPSPLANFPVRERGVFTFLPCSLPTNQSLLISSLRGASVRQEWGGSIMKRQIAAINLKRQDLGLIDEALRIKLRDFLRQRRRRAGAAGPGPIPQRTNSISW